MIFKKFNTKLRFFIYTLIMDKLFQSISHHLDNNVRIEVYSSLNQHLVDANNIVLWDKSAASISPEVYQKLRDVLNKKACNWYSLNKILPYHDFCIALLCSVGYTLNHNTMSKVSYRSFKSAWRAMSIMIGISDKDVQDWLKDRIQDRDATKYLTALGMTDLDSPTTTRRVSFVEQPTKLTLDQDIISKACSSKNIREIVPNGSTYVSTIVSKVVSTPECQLDNLRIIHSELTDGHF